MILGVDFDNTIVNYDPVFHAVALEQGLIPADLPARKASVRQYLIGQGREDAWTEMQGVVYGPRMLEALPFPGVIEFFRRGLLDGVDMAIVSHKTLHPYRGMPHDLHQAARGWLGYHGFYDPGRIGLGGSRVFFELTKAEKLARIQSLKCTHFIDDLPEIFEDPGFPDGVERHLFDPAGTQRVGLACARLASWADADRLLHDRRSRSA